MMKLVEKDSWLEPVSEEVQARYDRYESLLKYIENHYGSLKSFASAHEFFGFTYDEKRLVVQRMGSCCALSFFVR